MNLQQLPRQDKTVKRAFIPKLDYFLFADYDQIEMRVLAYYMAQLGDDSMARVLINGDDLHVESAQGIFQIDRAPLDHERQLGKNMNFSMVYGGGKPAVMRYLEEFNMAGGNVPVTWRYAGIVLDRFHERWPGIKRVVNALDASYHRGYLRTIAGARLHPDSHHKMLNAVVQSSAAEFMRRSLRICHNELRNHPSHLVCVVHDELVFDVAAEDLPLLRQMVPVWMDCFPQVSEVLPISTSLEYSDTNWAEKKGFDDYRL